MFQFSNVINGHIPSNLYMPKGYGQLGCSGFIVVDNQGNFLTKKSSAFLKKGEGAFRDVEALLSSYIGKTKNVQSASESLHPEYPYSIGNLAVLDGFKTQQNLNGREVKILGFEARTGRYSVQLVSDKRHISVLPCSLAPVSSQRTGESEESKIEIITSIETPDSVGIDSMDEEHESCSVAINHLLRVLPKATPVILRKVVDELESHFEHEELLMKKYSKQSQTSSFSALASHINDHRRILDIGREELNRVKLEQSKSMGTS